MNSISTVKVYILVSYTVYFTLMLYVVHSYVENTLIFKAVLEVNPCKSPNPEYLANFPYVSLRMEAVYFTFMQSTQEKI